MNNEPKWPNKLPMNAFDNGVVEWNTRVAYNRAIDECIEAWRAANDDPSKDPIGTVRKGPLNQFVSVRADIAIKGIVYPWTAMYPNGGTNGDTHGLVIGWPIIGAVPGTPAAEQVQDA